MLRRHFTTNSGNSTTLINGGLPKDIPNNTICYWTTESVEKINNCLNGFKCWDSNNTKLELINNIIINNVGTIIMSGDIYKFEALFMSDLDNLLDVRYVQLPKSCLGGVHLSYSSNLQELYIDSQNIELDTIMEIFTYVAYTPNLHTIKVDKDNPKYDSRNNCNAIIETETNTLIIGCKNTIIPNTVTSIGGSAFLGNTNLYTINIPNTINKISSYAFHSCGLTSITLPINITIGNMAFTNCINLTEINYKGTIEQWNNVTKGSDWNKEVPATVVHCTDGDVTI